MIWRMRFAGWITKATDTHSEYEIQGDQKVSVHLMITVQKHAKIFKKFQSFTMIT
jgi:hypothetical protein